MLKLLDTDGKRLELVDTHRNKNLAHALVTFAAAYGAALKFFEEAPGVVAVSLFFLAGAFFLRDVRSHQYSHGWSVTISMHLRALAKVINAPNEKASFELYYKEGQSKAKRGKECFSPTRFAYYILFLGAILSYFILNLGWVGISATESAKGTMP